jgi:DNA-binding NarL/FixJ family response regulator
MTSSAAPLSETLHPQPLRIVAVDDQPLFLEALAAVLSLAPDLEIVGRAGDGATGVELALRLRPDIVLMDVDMPRMDGFEATRRIAAALPGTAVVMVTGSALESDVEQARSAGAAGYVSKDRVATDLAGSIREAGTDPCPRLKEAPQVFGAGDILS